MKSIKNKENRSPKAPQQNHPEKEHVPHLIKEEEHKKPKGSRFGKKWFPYNK